MRRRDTWRDLWAAARARAAGVLGYVRAWLRGTAARVAPVVAAWVVRLRPLYRETGAALVRLRQWAFSPGRRRYTYGVLGAILLGAALAGQKWWGGPPLLSPPPTRLQVVAFYVSGGGGSTDSLPSFEAQLGVITTVSPFWYSLGPTGLLIRDSTIPAVVTLAKDHHVLVVPLVNNGSVNGDNSGGIDHPNQTARTLGSLVDQYDFDGVNLDFELLPPSRQADFTRFVQIVAAAMHSRHKILALSVFPEVGVSRDVAGVYDYRSLARFADYLVVMAYDHSNDSTPPGPIAPLPWLDENVHYAISQVGAGKVVLAIGMYGYNWTGAGGTQITADAAVTLAGQQGVSIQWDDQYDEPYFSYRAADGTLHTVWFQNGPAAAIRVALAAEDHLAGVAFWRLGDEEPGFWTYVRAALPP